MANVMQGDMDFENGYKGWGDRQLLEFVARQTYETCKRCEVHSTRIANIENGNKRASGIVGGISGTITAVVIGVISYFTNRSQ